MLRYVLTFCVYQSSQVWGWESHKYPTCGIHFWRSFKLHISRTGPHGPLWGECQNWVSCNIPSSSWVLKVLLHLLRDCLLRKSDSLENCWTCYLGPTWPHQSLSHGPKVILILSTWTSLSNLYLIRIFQAASPWMALTITLPSKPFLDYGYQAHTPFVIWVGFKFPRKQMEICFPSSFHTLIPKKDTWRVLDTNRC